MAAPDAPGQALQLPGSMPLLPLSLPLQMAIAGGGGSASSASLINTSGSGSRSSHGQVGPVCLPLTGPICPPAVSSGCQQAAPAALVAANAWPGSQQVPQLLSDQAVLVGRGGVLQQQQLTAPAAAQVLVAPPFPGAAPTAAAAAVTHSSALCWPLQVAAPAPLIAAPMLQEYSGSSSSSHSCIAPTGASLQTLTVVGQGQQAMGPAYYPAGSMGAVVVAGAGMQQSQVQVGGVCRPHPGGWAHQANVQLQHNRILSRSCHQACLHRTHA